MRINFEDGSFLTMHPSDNDEKKLTLITCGKKNKYTTTMSSSDISAKQVGELAEFLLQWLESLPVE